MMVRDITIHIPQSRGLDKREFLMIIRNSFISSAYTHML